MRAVSFASCLAMTLLFAAFATALPPAPPSLNPKWLAPTATLVGSSSIPNTASNSFIGSVTFTNHEVVGVALNPVNGSVRFSVRMPENSTSAQWFLCPENPSVAFLAIAPGNVNTAGLVVAVNAKTGDRLWSLPQELPSPLSGVSVLCSANGGVTTIIVGASAATAVTTATGALAWTTLVNGSTVSGSVFTLAPKNNAGAGTFFFQDDAGFHTVDIATGAQRVLFPISFVPDGSLQTPFATTKNLFLMNGGFNVTAFDAAGQSVWSLDELGQAVFGDVLLTKTSVPSLSAVNATTGRPLWFWQNLSTMVAGVSILNIAGGTADGSAVLLCSPVSPAASQLCASVVATSGNVTWTQQVAVLGTPIVTPTYYVIPNGNATQALNIATGESRLLHGIRMPTFAAETEGLLLLQGSDFTAAYVAW